MTFTLPDLGEGLRDAEIVAWHVAEGDHVAADAPLVSVETDKAVTEIPSPRAGRIAHLLAKPGDRVAVGKPLVAFAEGPQSDAGTVMGVLPEAPAAVPAPRVAASPAVRALARARGVDLAAIAGSGPDGTITRDDVARAATGAAGGEPLRGIRRAMAANMARARERVCAATLFDEADVEAWWAPDADVTTRLVRAVAGAVAAVPLLNATYDDVANTVRTNARVDLGLAVDTPEGLVVPVLRDAGARDAVSVRRDVDALKAAARGRTLGVEDLRDPTITLSNFGMLAGRHAALVVVPPQVAIVGAGRIAARAAPHPAGGVVFRHELPLSLTFDHRVVAGGDAARFLRAMIDALSAPG